MKRTLSIILVLVMCLTSLPVIFVSAEEAPAQNGLVNLFTSVENGGVGVRNSEGRSDLPAGFGSNAAYWCTEPIAVTTADTIYLLGDTGIGYHFSLFDKDGNGLGKSTNIKASGLTLVESLGSTFGIYSYTPAENVGYVRISQKKATYNTGCVLATKNQPFTAAEFKMWCVKNGGDFYTLLGEAFVNLFATAEKGGVGVVNAEGRSDLPAGYGTNTAYWCTEPIAVTPNDTVYFLGDDKIGYHVSLFDKDGNGLGKATNVKPSSLTAVEEIGKDDGSITYKIYSYTPAENVGFIRISQRADVYNTGCVIATKNQPFGHAILKNWCEANGGNYNDLLDIVEVDPSVTTGLNNLFTSVAKGGVGINNYEGRADNADGHGANANYWSTEPITLNTGDTVYFVGCSNIGHHVSTFDKNGAGIENIKPATLTVVAELGADVDGIIHCIYSYTAPENVGSIRISQKAATYNTKCVLVTKNQPFDKAKLIEWCTAAGANFLDLIKMGMPNFEVDTESPLYGKSALFIGDSITYGLGEERNQQIRLAWAGRLARMYNMTVVNAGDSGARVSQTGGSGFIIDGLDAWKAATPPDMVVMHGGVNDARYNNEVPLGTVDSNDTATFCGGLNAMFRYAKRKFPNAAKFYIANFFIPENKGSVSHMEEYYELAKQICAKHKITFIDLAGNEELNNTLANKDANGNPNWNKYMPDKLHPNSAGYDVITPYIAEALENFYLGITTPETPEDTGNGSEDTEATPGNTEATPGNTEATPGNTEATPENTDNAPANTTGAPTDEPKKSCGGFSAAAIMAAVAVSVLGAAITVIKKK